MGGNVKLETGERAEKINIGMMNADIFYAYKRNMHMLFEALNKTFKSQHDNFIWNLFDTIWTNGEMFSGSTRLMFKKPFSQFAMYKQQVGDIDIQVPNELMKDLKVFLENNKGKMFGNFKYIGFTNTGMQLNCLFKAPKYFDVFSKYVQIDFEGTEFENGRPTLFASFGHYSSWTDIKAGIKGLANKYLLRSLVAGMSKTEVTLLSSKTGKPIKSKEQENFYGFSVDKGFREKLKANYDNNDNHIMVNGKLSYFKIEPKDAVYEKDLSKIFKQIFCADPSEKEIYSLFSFVKTLHLMHTYCDDSITSSVFDDFIELLWGKDAQRLERDNPNLDDEVKTAMHKQFLKVFPFLKSKNATIKKMKKSYYESYKIS